LKISVIIPIYNVEKYLAECLDSCINQTLSDIEIICVNDKSPDSCAQILEKYQRNDSRIKVITHKKNRGLAEARNTGIINAKGEYLIFLDSDDMLTDCALEHLYNKAKNTNADIVFADYYTFYETLDSNYHKKAICNPSFIEFFSKFNEIFTLDDIYNQQDKEFLQKFLYDNIYTTCVWCKLFKTSVFKKNNILAPKLRCAEDFCMLKDYIYHSKIFSTINEVVMLYRKHENSFTSKKSSYVFSVFESYKHTIKMLKRTGYLNSEYTNIHKFYLDIYPAHYRFCPDSLIVKFWWRLHREIRKWNLKKINTNELTSAQKDILEFYGSCLPVFLFKTFSMLSKKPAFQKIEREFLKFFPYFLTYKKIGEINARLKEIK